MTGKSNCFFIKDIDILKMKACCKSIGCTINDYTTAIISNTLYEYFDNHKNDSYEGKKYGMVDYVDLAMPFSLRQPKKTIQEIRLENDLATLPVRI